MYNHGINTILPICTPAKVVKKVVEAIYGGHLELQDDVEALLILANCLQVSILQYDRLKRSRCYIIQSYSFQ